MPKIFSLSTFWTAALRTLPACFPLRLDGQILCSQLKLTRHLNHPRKMLPQSFSLAPSYPSSPWPDRCHLPCVPRMSLTLSQPSPISDDALQTHSFPPASSPPFSRGLCDLASPDIKIRPLHINGSIFSPSRKSPNKRAISPPGPRGPPPLSGDALRNVVKRFFFLFMVFFFLWLFFFLHMFLLGFIFTFVFCFFLFFKFMDVYFPSNVLRDDRFSATLFAPSPVVGPRSVTRFGLLRHGDLPNEFPLVPCPPRTSRFFVNPPIFFFAVFRTLFSCMSPVPLPGLAHDTAVSRQLALVRHCFPSSSPSSQ